MCSFYSSVYHITLFPIQYFHQTTIWADYVSEGMNMHSQAGENRVWDFLFQAFQLQEARLRSLQKKYYLQHQEIKGS